MKGCASVKKKALIIATVSVLIAALLIGSFFLLDHLLEPTAAEFINNSKTTLHYKLGDTDSITYPNNFVKHEYEEGYEYASIERDVIYAFTHLHGKDQSPVCSYIYVSKKDEGDPGVLFDIYIGESIRVEKNETLGTEKRSLFDFLEEHGFEEIKDVDYKESYLEYVDGNRCQWHCYRKNNVDLNVLVDQTGGSELRAFEIILTSKE